MRWLLVWLGLLGPSAFAAVVPQCDVVVDGVSYSLNQEVDPKRDLKKLLGILTKFKSSEQTAREFSARLKSFDLSVRPFYEREDLPAYTMAFFELKGTSVFLKQGELGTLIVLFFHEMVHALDERYATDITEWENNPDTEVKDRIVVAAERRAYDQQRLLIEEIYSLAPDCAEKYFTFHEGQKKIVARAVSDQELVDHYGSKTKKEL